MAATSSPSPLPTTTAVYRCQSTRLAVQVTSWENGPVAEFLTVCCDATVTGSGAGPVCRSCHVAVPDLLGGPVDLPGWETIAGDLGCPCPTDCATTALWKAEQETGSV